MSKRFGNFFDLHVIPHLKNQSTNETKLTQRIALKANEKNQAFKFKYQRWTGQICQVVFEQTRQDFRNVFRPELQIITIRRMHPRKEDEARIMRQANDSNWMKHAIEPLWEFYKVEREFEPDSWRFIYFTIAKISIASQPQHARTPSDKVEMLDPDNVDYS